MKGQWKNVAVFAGVALAVGCDNDDATGADEPSADDDAPVFDGSSLAAGEESVRAMAEELDDDEREQLEMAFGLLMMEAIGSEEEMAAEMEERTGMSAEELDSARMDDDLRGEVQEAQESIHEDALAELDGMTADEILDAAEAVDDETTEEFRAGMEEYQARAQQAEARGNLAAIGDGLRVHYRGGGGGGFEADDPASGGIGAGAGAAGGLPPSAPLTPADPSECCEGCEPDPDRWDHETWEKINFPPMVPHTFSYAYERHDGGEAFTAHAIADFECDGDLLHLGIEGEIEDGDLRIGDVEEIDDPSIVLDRGE